MKCPHCGLENPDSSLRCDCGYDFPSAQMKKLYEAPRAPWWQDWREALVFGISFLAGLACMAIAFSSLTGGVGEPGDFYYARILLPYAMLLAYPSFDVVAFLAAVTQFPVYGLLLATVAKKKRPSWLFVCVLVLLLLHVNAAALSFSYPLPDNLH